MQADSVSRILQHSGYRVEWSASVDEFLTKLHGLTPDIILMAMNFKEGRQAGAEAIHQAKEIVDTMPPVIFMSSYDDFEAYCSAVRAGSNRYLVKPIDPEKLLITIAGLIACKARPKMQILYIGQETGNQAFAESLRSNGLLVAALDDPREMFAAFQQYDPELVIIGNEGHDFSGTELAAIIRQNDNFSHLGILVLSATHDDDLREQALRLGVGSIALSTRPELLVAYIQAKLKRARWVRYLDKSLRQAHKLNEQQQVALDQHAIVSITDSSGEIIFVNDKFCQISGYSKGELIGNNHRLIKSSRHSDKFYKDLWGTISNGKVWQGEVCNLCKDGSEYWVECTIVPFMGDDGLPFQYISMRTDITELMNAQASLVEAKKIAEQASLAKTEFLARMSHELRTPMNAILGFGQLMQFDDETPLPAPHQENIIEIMRAGKHLLTLINEVLDLAKIETGKMVMVIEPVHLFSLMKECNSLMLPVAKRNNVALHFELESLHCSSLVALADIARLKQVLMNLISNAIKFNKDEGRVDVHCEAKSSSCVRITISDTGSGIPENRRSELFTPFNCLGAKNKSVDGAGVGLVLSKQLVEAMDGRIGYESVMNEGTTFWIEIPAEARKTAFNVIQEKELTSDQKEHVSSSETVLYIEDNPANLRLVDQLIECRDSIRLLTAHTPELGIDLATTHRPDLILLDINLPGSDGYQVLECLREIEATRSIPVVAISANTMSHDVEKGIAAGFKEYMKKPIDVAEFYAMLDRNLCSQQECGNG